MHVDARMTDSGSLIEGDVCIVGAGAAGISMALEWINAPYRIILLEGGGFDVTRSQDVFGVVHIVAHRAVSPGGHGWRHRQRSRDLDIDGYLGTATAFVKLLNRETGIRARVQNE